jgi:putative protease
MSRQATPIMGPEETIKWIASNQLVQETPVSSARLNVLVRQIEQLDQLEGLHLGTIYLDFEFGKEYHSAAERVRKMGYRVGIATTRIFKPGEIGHLKVIERISPDEVLVRNLGALEYLGRSGLALVGDFSLNVTNSLSAEWFRSKGLKRICPSYDLNGNQLVELLGKSGATDFEITVHHYIPAFHMEHCVFAAFLSNGSSYRDCGRPCEKHRVELRDRKGTLHPLKADAECRNTMFNGTPQSALRLIPELIGCGVSHFRVDALYEDASTLRSKIEAYLVVLNGSSNHEALIRKLGSVERFGVTDGQLYSIHTHQDRKKAFAHLDSLEVGADPALKLIRGGEEKPC